MRVQSPPVAPKYHATADCVGRKKRQLSNPTTHAIDLRGGEAPKHAHARAINRQSPNYEASHSTQPWTAGSGATTHRRRELVN